jgi:hypothetical protein
MAVRNATIPSLMDVMTRLDPGGGLSDIAEILTQTNEANDDVSWTPGNLVTGDRFTMRTGKPTVGFRRLNEGVARSKSTTSQVDEQAAELVAEHQIDRKLAILSGNIAQYRMDEGRSFIESMSDKLWQTMFYGNSLTDDKSFMGLAPRFNSLSGSYASQIIDGGGTGTDNRSLWLIVWAPDKITGIYPKNTKGGLLHMDTTSNKAIGPDGFPIGDRVLDADGNPYLAYTDHWEWNCGLKIKDPRYAVRAANIDFSLLSKDRASGADLQDLMVQMMGRIQGLNGNAAFYASRDIHNMLDRQASNDGRAFNGFSRANFGRPGIDSLAFRGVPVRRMDALNVDEARVV